MLARARPQPGSSIRCGTEGVADTLAAGATIRVVCGRPTSLVTATAIEVTLPPPVNGYALTFFALAVSDADPHVVVCEPVTTQRDPVDERYGAATRSDRWPRTRRGWHPIRLAICSPVGCGALSGR